MLIAYTRAALRGAGQRCCGQPAPHRCLALAATASCAARTPGHDSQANFPRTNTSVPSEWIPPKIDGATSHQPDDPGDWIVPGVHVLWDDVSQMRLRRRTKLLWASPPRTVLLVKKWGDARVTAQMLEIADWLTARGARVLVEENVQAEMPDYDPFIAVTGLPRPDFAGAGALDA